MPASSLSPLAAASLCHQITATLCAQWCPATPGVTHIKWLTRVCAQPEEAQGVWQRGIAYKALGPDVTAPDGHDLSQYAPINELPVTSAILSPLPNATIEADADGDTIDVRGFAWSGGGRGIVRVDVSADDGATWHTASLGEGSEQPRHKAWAWTFWKSRYRSAPGR